MKKLLNNKPLLLGIIGLLAVVLIGSFVLLRNSSSENPTDEPGFIEEEVPTISPDELGFSIELSSDGKKVILTVENTEDIEEINYELSYLAEGDIPRGAIGDILIKNKGKAVTQQIDLGTCSDVCHYDKDVRDIKMIIKVTKSDGSIFSSELSLDN